MSVLNNKDLEILITRLRELSSAWKIVIPKIESLNKFQEKDLNKLNLNFKNKLQDKEVVSSIFSFEKEELQSEYFKDLISDWVFIPLFIIPDLDKDNSFSESEEELGEEVSK